MFMQFFNFNIDINEMFQVKYFTCLNSLEQYQVNWSRTLRLGDNINL